MTGVINTLTMPNSLKDNNIRETFPSVGNITVFPSSDWVWITGNLTDSYTIRRY